MVDLLELATEQNKETRIVLVCPPPSVVERLADAMLEQMDSLSQNGSSVRVFVVSERPDYVGIPFADWKHTLQRTAGLADKHNCLLKKRVGIESPVELLRSFAPRKSQAACFFVDELNTSTAPFVMDGVWDWLPDAGHKEFDDYCLDDKDDPLEVWLDVAAPLVETFRPAIEDFLAKYSAVAVTERA